MAQNIPWQDIRTGRRSYFLGNRMAITGASVTNDTTTTFVGILLGLDYTASTYSDTDYFTVSIVSGNTIFDTIYMKSAGEAFRIERPLLLAIGDVIRVIFTNASGTNKTFWYNLEFARSD